MRLIWFVSGCLAVALGVIGAALPLLPTVPFMLVAAFCFARSSPAFERRLLDHPRIGPHIRRWRAHGVVPRRAKWASAAGMALGWTISALAGLSALALAGQAAVMIAVSLWLWRRPERAPSVERAGGAGGEHEGPA